MMKGTLALVLLLATTVLPGQAQPGPLTAFSFLRLEPTARGAALGGAASAVPATSAGALFYNPALLSPAAHHTLSVSYLNHLADINAGAVAFAHHAKGLGTLGAGVRFLSYGTFEGFDERGNETGTFGAGDVALTLGLARSGGTHWRYGANLHLIYSRIEAVSAKGLAVDLGVLYRFPKQQLALSASVHNAGFALDRYNEMRSDLPFDVRLGVSKRLAHLPLLLTVTSYNLHRLGSEPAGGPALDRALRHLAFGAEVQIVDAFCLRLGYNPYRASELRQTDRFDTAGFSAGFGLAIARFRFDYAYRSWSSIGGLHQFSLSAQL